MTLGTLPSCSRVHCPLQQDWPAEVNQRNSSLIQQVRAEGRHGTGHEALIDLAKNSKFVLDSMGPQSQTEFHPDFSVPCPVSSGWLSNLSVSVSSPVRWG